jgi:23S rRNA (adenine1618-N6)-methyltransferase
VPNRHNYILWLKKLLDSSTYNEPGERLRGLDIGTGASCIYPLLGTTQRDWDFVATGQYFEASTCLVLDRVYLLFSDIDPKSLSYARKNVERNGLNARIRLLERNSSDTLIPIEEADVNSIDFVMINPPFYKSDEEMMTAAKKKERPPHSACTGAPTEMVCKGGEVAFVSSLINESLELREKIRWYTSMLGLASSVESLVTKLREQGIHNYAVAEFVQGKQTRRWALGWSFRPMRPFQEAARGLSGPAWKKVLPAISEVELLSTDIQKGLGDAVSRFTDILQSLELLSWTWDQEKQEGHGRARENVWSRAWRRKKLSKTKDGGVEPEPTLSPADSDVCKFGFLISIHTEETNIKILLRWVEGLDQAIFESFRGFMQRTLLS